MTDTIRLQGSWWQGHSAKITASLLLPEQGRSAVFSFDIDTGASHTVICPADAEVLGLDFADLAPPVTLPAVGKGVLVHPTNSVLSFWNDNQVVSYPLLIGVLNPSTSQFPRSLLGRDLLDRMHMLTMPEYSSLVLHARDPDGVVVWKG